MHMGWWISLGVIWGWGGGLVLWGEVQRRMLGFSIGNGVGVRRRCWRRRRRGRMQRVEFFDGWKG